MSFIEENSYLIYSIHHPVPGTWTIITNRSSRSIFGITEPENLDLIDITVTSEGPSMLFIPALVKDNHFQVESNINTPPSVPRNPNPPNNAIEQPRDWVALSWETQDIDNDPLIYEIYFGTTSPPPKIETSINAPFYYQSFLQESTVYYWRVIAIDSHGARSESPIWQFDTSRLEPTPTITPTTTATLPTLPPTIEYLGPNLNNGGFESGNMSGWTQQNGTVDVTNEEPHSGNYCVHGTSGGDESEGQSPVSFYREFSLREYQVWIDAGYGIAYYDAWLHNGNSEYYQYHFKFFNDFDQLLYSYDTGWIRNSGGGYRQHGEQHVIPIGTAYVRIIAEMKRYSGSYTDVDIDDFRFKIWFEYP